MDNKWLFNIRHVAPGEPVKSNVVGRPDRALEERTNYLKDRIEAAELGRALFDTEATIASDVLPGQPVFWNTQTQQYERALAAVETDPTSQALVMQPSSDCVGILYSKKSPTLGDVVMQGLVRLSAISNAVDGPVAPGKYYLSAAAPGRLVKQRPPVTVTVCYVQGAKETCNDDPWVIVMPQARDFLEDHIHYRFELETTAAGTATLANGRYTISNTDATKQGWLPAGHSVFGGKAPAGAVFGYNIGAHTALSRVWPPVPMQAVAMLWDKGASRVGATEIPLGSDGLAICNSDGIWWMSDCSDDVPWVRDLTAASSSSSTSSASSSGPECPRNENMRVSVVYLRMVFGNDKSVVTSLEPAAGSPIIVTNCDGLPARTGDLELDVDMNLLVLPPDVAGSRVIKRIDAGRNFRTGLVTEGLVSGSAPIVLSSVSETATASRALTPTEKTALGFSSGATVTAYQGLVKITFNDSLAEREIAPQIIRLSDVVERLYADVPYLGFPAGQDSSVRLRLNVHSSGLGNSLQMVIRAQLFGRVNGTLPLLQVTYRRLARPTSGAIALPTTDVTPALTFASNVALGGTDRMVEVNSSAFTVVEGDTVLVTLRRPGTDAYSGEVGLLRLSGIITATA